MGKVKTSNTTTTQSKRRPALTPEAQENHMASLAMNLVEQRLIDGTASSQETTHFLKLVSSKARLEAKILEQQAELMEAKKEALQSQKRVEELYAEALKAMREYNGHGDPDDY